MQLNLTQFEMMAGESAGASYVKVASKGDTIIGARLHIFPHPKAVFAGFKLRIEGERPTDFECRKGSGGAHSASFFMRPVCRSPAFHNWIVEEPWSEWALSFLSALKNLGYDILVDEEMFSEYVTSTMVATYPPVEKVILDGAPAFITEYTMDKVAAAALGEKYSEPENDEYEEEEE